MWPVGEEVIGASLMNGNGHLRFEGPWGESAGLGIGEVKVIGADIVSPGFSQVREFW